MNVRLYITLWTECLNAFLRVDISKMFFLLNNFFLFIAVILESIYYAFNHLFYLGDILAWYYAADKFLISQSFMPKALWTECLNTRKEL